MSLSNPNDPPQETVGHSSEAESDSEDFYETQRCSFHDLFFEGGESEDLVLRLEHALNDDLLPLIHRAEFEAMAASPCPLDEAEAHLSRAWTAFDELTQEVQEAEESFQFEMEEDMAFVKKLINSVMEDISTRRDREAEGIPDDVFDRNAPRNSA